MATHQPAAHAMRISGQSWFLAAVAAASAAVVGYVACVDLLPGSSASGAARGPRLENIPFDGAKAYEYLKQICDLGPRVSGTPGMARQQEMLVEHFEKLGAKVTRQTFRARHPVDGTAVEMANLLIQWHPEKKERLLVGARLRHAAAPRPRSD